MSDQQIILGLGTGRCGTVSLGTFLDTQPDTRIFHEGHISGDKHSRVLHEASIGKSDGDRHLFRWNGSSEEVLLYLENLSQHVEAQRCGDVAYYFLPHAEAVLERWPDTKFVILKRERSATVESYLRKTEGRNHWMDHEGSQWQTDSAFDPTFPTLDASSKRAAVERYWDLYYERVDQLLNLYPDSFLLRNMHDLNTRDGRREILSFLGYENKKMVLSGTYKENTGGKSKKARA